MGKVVKVDFERIDQYSFEELSTKIDSQIKSIESIHASMVALINELRVEQTILKKLMRRIKVL
jgi:hypothetical protein